MRGQKASEQSAHRKNSWPTPDLSPSVLLPSFICMVPCVVSWHPTTECDLLTCGSSPIVPAALPGFNEKCNPSLSQTGTATFTQTVRQTWVTRVFLRACLVGGAGDLGWRVMARSFILLYSSTVPQAPCSRSCGAYHKGLGCRASVGNERRLHAPLLTGNSSSCVCVCARKRPAVRLHISLCQTPALIHANDLNRCKA